MHVRELDSIEDFAACVALQHLTWGADSETVPVSLLCGAMHVGGLAVGAFGPDGRLLGFVFGLAGTEHGVEVHWSHMLAVREDARGAGIGGTLKEWQRAELACRGVARIYWTFDPLQARNAHLNLNRLGARVIEYVVDMYGVTRSPLHLGMATDRFIVMSDVSDAQRNTPETSFAAGELPVFTPFPQARDTLPAGMLSPALIEIPWDIQQIVTTSPEIARRWRVATREHFQRVLQHGYTISALRRDVARRRAFYEVGR